MNRTIVLLLPVLLALAGCTPPAVEHEHEHDHDAAEAEAPHGPHGGLLLTDGDFTLELAVFETGVAPEFHAWAVADGRAVSPADVSVTVRLARLDGAVDTIAFAPAGDYLRGDREVHEPHSFDVQVTARSGRREHAWTYPSYEGRTTIAADVATASGIVTRTAGPGTIAEALTLYGAIAADTTRVREVRARFPGVIRSVAKAVGTAVRAGETLATVESNESLQTYTVTAPIAGIVTRRHAEPGEQTDTDGLFEIADFSTVWAELTVFSRDRARLREGMTVEVATDGAPAESGTIAYLAPTGDRSTQSVTVRVVLDNAAGRWTPGQFVEGRVTISATPVALAVPLAAVQKWADFDVVFARYGDVYEVRMLELGRRDAANVEVLSGLAAGTEFVTENSYLIKADIEKAGASHDD